ncbi:MAG: trypsin-like peptidase domain-containing protein [Chitinophagaceae bacterium]|nr:trypsin-like peptidase domain-containing protein [Chitinophagaceae bacterium]MCW5925953.1 trypsin-like peptidase domain-containing protein [Chitinophagaceae bacterium]
MRKILLISFLFFSNNGFCQLTNVDREIRDNISLLRQVTVSIGIDTTVTYRNINGSTVTERIFNAVGTGVIFYVKVLDSITIPCLVTAKHVLYDSSNSWNPSKVNIRFSSSDSIPINQHKGYELDLYDNELKSKMWIEHPNKKIDLACIFVDNIKFDSVRPNIKITPYSFFPPDEEYYEGKEIYVLGYPGAVGLDLLNKAIVRKGIISWVPNNINSAEKMLIDCNIFPGNSGGPVFSIPRNTGLLLEDTVFRGTKFFGIVSERRFSENTLMTPNGQDIVDSRGLPIRSLESIGVGIIISAKRVQELLHTAKEIVEPEIKKKQKK